MNRNQEPLYTLCAHSLSPGASPDDRRTESLNSVNGAPRTRQSGARTATADVAAICILITAGAYLPTPDDVATSNTRHPRAQLTDRNVDHCTPCCRRRSQGARAFTRGAAPVWQHVVGHGHVRAGAYAERRRTRPCWMRHGVRAGPDRRDHAVPDGGMTHVRPRPPPRAAGDAR